MASTVGNVISDLRGMIKQVQDDSDYTDRFLYSILSKAKAMVLRQRLLRSRLSSYNQSTYCIDLELAKSHDCDCVAVGCEVRKSIYEIPRTLSNRMSDLIKIETLGGKLIREVTEEQLHNEIDDDIKGGALAWSMRSRKLIIWNNPKLVTVQVTGVWEDESEWLEVQSCKDSQGNNIPCEDPKDKDFGMESAFLIPIYQIALQLLNVPLQLKEDVTSNQNSEI